jgi:hypothetical protein
MLVGQRQRMGAWQHRGAETNRRCAGYTHRRLPTTSLAPVVLPVDVGAPFDVAYPAGALSARH